MKHISLLLLTFFFTVPTFAFYTFQDTGDLLKEGQMRWATEVQFITSGDDGANIIGRLDKGYSEEVNLRFEAGVGTTDYVFGGYVKWVPFPDFDKQPAIGFQGGVHVASFEDETELALRFTPFASKEFDTDIGLLTPYAALPFAFRSYNDESDIPLFFTLGSRYRHPEFQHCDFTAELGFDVSDAFSYLSIGAIFPAFE
jgi:hypothetical protein